MKPCWAKRLLMLLGKELWKEVVMVVKERDKASTHCDELKKMLDELIESQKAKVLLELEVLLLM